MIDASSRRFKSDGFDGAGISALVSDAGLTNGAFYGHFASKDDLIATVVSEQMAAQLARVEELPAGMASVELFVREYLSPEHRDDPANGCPSAALLDEVPRQHVATREAYTTGAKALIDAVARLIANGDNDRMVPTPLSEDLHRRLEGSRLVIYPNSGHGGIFQFYNTFAPVAAAFLTD